MGGRTKPNWAIFDGGPFDGQRRLLLPNEDAGPLLMHTRSDTPGMVVVHEYLVTHDYRRVEFDNKVKGSVRVVRFVRTVGERPAQASPPHVMPTTPR